MAGVPRDTIQTSSGAGPPTYEKLLQICDALRLRLTIVCLEMEESAAAAYTGRAAANAGAEQPGKPRNAQRPRWTPKSGH